MGCACSNKTQEENPRSRRIDVKNVGASKNKIFISNRNKIKNVENAENDVCYKNQNIEIILNDQKISKFNDEFFLPEITSLIPADKTDPSYEKTPKSYKEEYKTYIWLRFDEIYGPNNYSFFKDKMDPQDICQGSLGSCYLLCALMGLSEYEERIKRLFVTSEINSKGAYAVKFLLQGQYKIITVDDYIPCKPTERTPAFSTSKDKEVWVLIIEKAWAKVNGSCYMKTWLGTPHEALTVLSEAPCIYEYHPKYVKRGKQTLLWNKILTALKKRWILCADTEEVSNAEEIGLVPFHAYSIIGAYDLQGNNIRLVKIRNPWGNKEWKGDFSVNSNTWTSEIKKEIGQSNLKLKQGTFFMSFEDFLHYFSWTFFSKIEDNYHYRYSKFILSKENSIVINNSVQSISVNENKIGNLEEFVTAFIEVKTQTRCFICFHQPQKRFKDVSQSNPNKDTPIGLMMLLRYEETDNKPKYTIINADFINWEKIYMEVNLQKGEYHIFCKSFIEYDKSLELVISTYAENPIEIYKLPSSEIYQNWLEDILIQLAKSNKNKEYFHKQETKSYSSNILYDNSSSINIAYGIFYYENNSEKGTLHVKIYFQNASGINILNHSPKLSNEYELIIPPKQNKSLYIQLLNLPWLSKTSWSHVLWYDYPIEVLMKKYQKNSEKQTIEKDLDLYTASYEGGYLIILDNKSSNKYSGYLNFNDLSNFILSEDVSSIENGKKVNIIVNPKSKYQLKITIIDKSKDTSLKFVKFFKITQ